MQSAKPSENNKVEIFRGGANPPSVGLKHEMKSYGMEDGEMKPDGAGEMEGREVKHE